MAFSHRLDLHHLVGLYHISCASEYVIRLERTKSWLDNYR